MPAEEGNNQYNLYKKIQRFARTKTLRVKQAFCKGNNKYNSFAWTSVEPNILLRRETNEYTFTTTNNVLRGQTVIS